MSTNFDFIDDIKMNHIFKKKKFSFEYKKTFKNMEKQMNVLIKINMHYVFCALCDVVFENVFYFYFYFVIAFLLIK